MRDDLSDWAYSDKIKSRILASKSIEEFQSTCNAHELWYSNWVRFPIVYYTIKAFPHFNERMDCLCPEITKLSDFVTSFKISRTIKDKPGGIFFWDDDNREQFQRGRKMIEQVFVSVTPEFEKFYTKIGGTCLRAITRTFGDQDYWVAIFAGQKYGMNKLITYLDTRTEYFDLNTNQMVSNLKSQ